MYRASRKVDVAAVVANWGTKLTFLEEGDPLPTALKLGMAYKATQKLKLSLEGVGPKSGPASLHMGAEFRPLEPFALRASYRTDEADRLGPMGGFTAGLGVEFNRYDFSYAWVPLGDFGNAHYFSVGYRFNKPSENGRDQ
jgi:hypothetical protein